MIDNLVLNDQRCFVSSLIRLRDSSKEAVVSADSASDPYMMYMHVDRPVQERFVSILKNTCNTAHAELILLCGSVGDGKSHMLSYCKQCYPELMDKFYLHNDSTASLYVDKPASYTLKKLMEDFSDARIESSRKKVILAINLGTLSNFLDSDQENKFSRLKSYIENTGILDEKTEKNIPDTSQKEEQYFHGVNFADYHLYELRESGVTSEYIKGILNRITAKDRHNDFYMDYCDTCKKCSACKQCPVRANYELLSDQEIQDGIISVLIENIVKNKLIISTRALLNLVYELLINEKYWERGSVEPRKLPDKLGTVQYYESLLPNMLFDKNSSEIFSGMHSVDPMCIRNEKVDEFFVSYENTTDIGALYKENLQEYCELLDRTADIDFTDGNMHPVKEITLKLYIRMLRLLNRNQEMLPEDRDYREYMDALYAWNKGNYRALNDFYEIVKKGILRWNGEAGKNEMQIISGNPRSGYHLVQDIKIRVMQDPQALSKEEPLYSFKEELRIKFRIGAEHDRAELDVDFALYRLLKEVLKGYVPGINDRRVNVKCTEFVSRISQGGSKMEEIYIRDMSQKEMKEYTLYYNGSEYSFEVN